MIKNKITLNVLADISRKVKKADFSPQSKGILVFFNGSSMDLTSRLKEISQLKGDKSKLSLGFSFMAERIQDREEIVRYLKPSRVYGEEDIFDLKGIVEGNSKLVMPNVTINTLSKVGSGMIDSFASNILWTYLYYGSEVFLDFSSVRTYLGVNTKNQAIKRLIDLSIKSIKDMGGLEIEEGKYVETILANGLLAGGDPDINYPAEGGNPRPKVEKKILVEKDIDQLLAGSVFTIPRGSILTPLAKDKIREKKIQIKIKE